MTDFSLHLRDDQLLLYGSGELRELSSEVVSHAKSCQQCRVRLEEIEAAMAEFTDAQRIACDVPLPSAAGPRALLKAQLSELSRIDLRHKELPSEKSARSVAMAARLPWNGYRRVLALGLLVATCIVMVTFLAYRGRQGASSNQRMSDQTIAGLSLSDEPNTHITPGAVIVATRSQVCAASSDEPPAIPAALKTKVLQLYGVASGREDAYEVDYLITPELGGATDVRNLWPEPYDHTVWNAHVKDRLEDRLRDMVCRGEIDLATAQRDISTDWIAAYRKYFRANVPTRTGSS